MFKYSFLGSLLAALLLVSCQEQTTDLAAPTSLSPTLSELLLEHTLDRISGSHRAEGHHVNYSVAAKANRYTLSVTIDGGKILSALADYEQFEMVVEGNNNSLTPTEALALNTTAVQLAETLFAGASQETLQMTLAENTLVQLLDWFSYIPPGYELGKADVADAELWKSRRDDGIRCVTRNRTYRISWDDSRGNRSTRDKAGRNRGGSYNCMARCGAGCGRSWIPSAWTLDCFEHDECSRRNDSSGGAADSNCGDEWLHAADDWTFGVIRGCSG